MLCYNLYQPLPRLNRCPCDMGCDEELFFVLYSKEWIILSHGFHRKHVQAGGPDFSGIESSGKIRFIYDGTSAEIEEDSTIRISIASAFMIFSVYSLSGAWMERISAWASRVSKSTCR